MPRKILLETSPADRSPLVELSILPITVGTANMALNRFRLKRLLSVSTWSVTENIAPLLNRAATANNVGGTTKAGAGVSINRPPCRASGAGRMKAYRLRTMLTERPMPWELAGGSELPRSQGVFAIGRRHKLPSPYACPVKLSGCIGTIRPIRVTAMPRQQPRQTSTSTQAASSCPVDRFVCNGFGDVIGNVWQWTETAVDSLPGFRIHPYYDDFSTPTFDSRPQPD